MKRDIIVEGDSYDDAVAKGLSILSTDENSVNIEIIEKGQSMMNVVLKPYKIIMTLKESSPEISTSKNIKDLVKLDYREDGVFFSLIDVNYNLSKSDEEKIINYLKRKKIRGIQNKAVFHGLMDSSGSDIKIAEAQEEQQIDEEIIVDISKDELEGYITLVPPEGGKLLEKEDIIKAMNAAGISFGIDSSAIDNIINNRVYNERLLVAKGKIPKDGEDAVIKFHINLYKKAKPNIREDGSVDYRHLDLIENVKKGQLLASYKPATIGTPGRTVTSKTIQPKPGKSIPLPVGKGIDLSADRTELYAAIDGRVEIINKKLNVFTVYEVKHNVDNSTGNIDFPGNVIINGNVLTGFEVRAGGFIEVKGIVEGATLVAKGDIVLRKGIQGMSKGYVETQANLISRFIENGNVVAKGNIISEAIMHSKVSCGGKIDVGGKRGLIVGGKIHAGESINAVIIGSPMATQTELEVGIDPEIKEEYLSLKKELAQIENEEKKANQILALLSKLESSGDLNEDKKQIRIKTLRTKLQYKERIPEIKDRILQIEEKLNNIDKGKISARNVVYPGVNITIGKSAIYIKEEAKFVTYRKQKGDITFSSFQ